MTDLIRKLEGLKRTKGKLGSVYYNKAIDDVGVLLKEALTQPDEVELISLIRRELVAGYPHAIVVEDDLPSDEQLRIILHTLRPYLRSPAQADRAEVVRVMAGGAKDFEQIMYYAIDALEAQGYQIVRKI